MEWHCNTIICVDDEDAVLETYRSILASSEEDKEIADILNLARERNREQIAEISRTKPVYNLLVADSGEKAVELIQKEIDEGRSIAAGFFDMRMPGMDGYETIKAIRSLVPSIFCAMVTAYTDLSVAKLRELFTDDSQDELLYIKKGFSSEELEQAAFNMVSSWNRKRKVERHLQAIEKHKRGLSRILHAVSSLFNIPPHSIQFLISGFLYQLLGLMEAKHGFSIYWDEEDGAITYGVGRFQDESFITEFIEDCLLCRQGFRDNRSQMDDRHCFIPLTNESLHLGGLYVESDDPVEQFVDIKILEVFKNQIIQMILNSLFHNQAMVLEQKSITDELTGLYNRRFLTRKLITTMDNSPSSRNLSTLTIDIDDFKEVNDSFGHDSGDAVLKKIGAILKFEIRDNDLVWRNSEGEVETSHYAVRLGGEEFCIILLDTDLEGAVTVGERLRMSIADHDFRVRDNTISMTVSIGISSTVFSPHMEEKENMLAELLSEADKALYEAKRAGKNRIRIWGEISGE